MVNYNHYVQSRKNNSKLIMECRTCRQTKKHLTRKDFLETFPCSQIIRQSVEESRISCVCTTWQHKKRRSLSTKLREYVRPSVSVPQAQFSCNFLFKTSAT